MLSDPKYNDLVNMRKNCFLLMCSDIQSGTGAPEPPPKPTLKSSSLSPNDSLQQMIEYYSQDGGDGTDGGPTPDEKARFKALNIERDPIMEWSFPYGSSSEPVTNLDKRFCAGINSTGGNTCFFVTALQYLMSNEEFLKIMIELNSRPDNVEDFVSNINFNASPYVSESQLETTTHDCRNKIKTSRDVLKNLLLIFRWWRSKTPFNINNVNNINGFKVVNELYDFLGFVRDKQADASEVFTQIVGAFECLDNPYVEKFIRSGIKYKTETTINYPSVGGFTREP